ncbi:MAG TPA: hypothetical protein EYN66_23305 [Myxococcales bacterium]|nr:hypothetical protein [Myxococcales bacterium]
MNVVTGDASMIPRPLLRPICKVNDENIYLRHVDDIRTVLLSLLATPHFTLNEGSFLMAYFSNQIKDVYKKGCGEDELVEVANQIDFITRIEVQEEIVQQYRTIATDGSVALALGSVILESAAANKSAHGFRQLAMEVLAGILETEQAAFFEAYDQTQQTLQERAGKQLTQYFGNFCAHYLVHNPLIDADSLLDYVQRLFLTKALIQLLMFCHPEMQAAAKLPDDEMHAEIERISIRIFYLVTRAAHHSKVLTNIQEILERDTEQFALTTLLIRL